MECRRPDHWLSDRLSFTGSLEIAEGKDTLPIIAVDYACKRGVDLNSPRIAYSLLAQNA